MNNNKYIVIACALLTYVAIAIATNIADAHCGGNHTGNHPHCGGDTEPPPDSGGSADPQIVYLDGGIFLANADGTSQTQIRSGGVGPKLDTPNERVLFYDNPSLGRLSFLGLIPYSFVDGNIVVGQEQQLISSVELGGKLSSEGVSDWSPDGTKYSYSYRTQSVPDGPWVYWMMVAPDPVLEPNGIHSVAYQSEDNGGLNSATWDASGDFIYHQDNPLDGTPANGLIVIDVRTFPGETVAEFDLSQVFINAGFAPESNVQRISASYETGGDHLIGGEPGKYSFNPADPSVPATSDTSLCLMLSVIDWSRKDGRFVVIIDLPQIFDPDSSGDGLSCSFATAMRSPILDFQASDFTTGDTGIFGHNYAKGKPGGLWVYDLGSESRSKIVAEGSHPDWTN